MTSGATGGTALGQGAAASFANAVALGRGSTTAGASSIAGNAALGIVNNAGAVAAGSGNVVSVGAPGAERQIQNVAAGRVAATSTDAVNGSQLFSVASSVATTSANVDVLGTTTAAALGGGASYAPATGITGLGYGLNGSAATFTNVVSGIQALASGAAGPLQYAVPGTPSNTLNLVGTGGPVTLHNVAAGALTATSTDAVNGSQLFATNQTIANIAGGGGIKYFHANSMGPDAVAAGTDSVAIGPSAVSGGAGSIAAGNGATASGTGSIAIGQAAQAANGGTAVGAGAMATGDPTAAFGAGAVALGNNSSAFGAGAVAGAAPGNGDNTTAVGQAAFATGNNATALGQGASATLANSVAVGQGSTTQAASSIVGNTALGIVTNAGAATGVVSVGAPGAERQIQNVASGAVTAGSTDAVTGSQLFAVATNANTLGSTTATAIGGGATYAPTTGITGPSYNLNGSSATFTNVVAGEQALASGGAGPVQYSTPGTPSNSVNLVGIGGPVTLGNVAGGTVAPGSNQAVNGGQLYGTAQSVATALGGGAKVNANGMVSAPSYQVAGKSYNDVGSAITALQGNTQGSLSGLQGQIDRNNRSANAGIATAIAMGGSMPIPGKTITVSAHYGNYGGQNAFAGNAVARVTENVYVDGSIGFSDHGSAGVRGGVSIGW